MSSSDDLWKNILMLTIITMSSAVIVQVKSQPRALLGRWQIVEGNIGISAMHMQVLHDNTVVMFDRTDFGPSLVPLSGGRCRVDPADTALQTDCTAHSVLFDLATNSFRALTLLTDSWCSSGAVLPNGTLIQTGGFNDGDHVVRSFTPCNARSCDWIETPNYLAQRRWYASNQILPDGRVIVVGGRRQFNYEFFPRESGNNNLFWMGFLRDTIDPDENNLYPFLHLLPDGNLFVFANTRSVLFDYNGNRVVRDFPPIPGGDPRNYPSSGSSVLLPLDENSGGVGAEVMICGGAPRGSHQAAMNGTSFAQALSSCGRMRVSDLDASWAMEDMPMGRVMGDMVILPSGDVAILNGAARGTAGWEAARDPVMTPVLYSPAGAPGRRFSVMAAASRPRLYHSAAVLIPDGRVLVGGSNPHVYYNFTGVDFPTDLSLEAFSPPYMSVVRPRVLAVPADMAYGRPFSVTFAAAGLDGVSFRLISPAFSTHSFGMNQRMVVMRLAGVSRLVVPFFYSATVVGPSSAAIAPPGYYMLFVVRNGIPSVGTWVNLHR